MGAVKVSWQMQSKQLALTSSSHQVFDRASKQDASRGRAPSDQDSIAWLLYAAGAPVAPCKATSKGAAVELSIEDLMDLAPIFAATCIDTQFCFTINLNRE